MTTPRWSSTNAKTPMQLKATPAFIVAQSRSYVRRVDLVQSRRSMRVASRILVVTETPKCPNLLRKFEISTK